METEQTNNPGAARCPRCGRVSCGCTSPPDTFIPVGPAGAAPRWDSTRIRHEIVPHAVVTFEETGEERIVERDCEVCHRAAESYGCGVVSPSGIAHIAVGGGDTLCGHDATGSDWWWPL